MKLSVYNILEHVSSVDCNIRITFQSCIYVPLETFHKTLDNVMAIAFFQLVYNSATKFHICTSFGVWTSY